MYSKRVVHKAYVDGNAYITVNDPYVVRNGNPFRAPVKGEKLKNFDIPRIPKNAELGNFSKLSYAAGGYAEANKYKPVDGDDRKGFGFGSKNASRRDEFSNSIRTEQYRAQLIKEQQVMAKTTENNLKELTKILEAKMHETASETKSPSKTTGFNYDDNCPQYDIGRTKVTPFDPRSKTDSFYKFDGETGKRLGTHRPISMEVGDNAWGLTYKPPSHGGKSEVKNFFDKSHLTVGNN